MSACSSPVEFDSCRSQVEEGFLILLSEELEHRGINHSLKGGQLCYKSEDRFEVDRAGALITSYRKAVMTILKSKETEKRIINWLTNESKHYQISQTTEGKRFIVIFSDSKEDQMANRKQLSKLENGK